MSNSRGQMKMRCDVWRYTIADLENVDLYGKPISVYEKVHTAIPCRIWVVSERSPVVDTSGTKIVVSYRGIVPKRTEVLQFDEIKNVTNRRGRFLFGDNALFRINSHPILPGEFVGLYMERINEGGA